MKPVTDSLIKLARKGKLLSRKYVREKIRAVEKREAASAGHLDRVKDCLRRIVDYAVSKKVKLGIEGRRGYEEIPSERELPALLDELNSPQVGYWHDFGHIQIKENLALLDHAEWLRKMPTVAGLQPPSSPMSLSRSLRLSVGKFSFACKRFDSMSHVSSACF